MWRSARLDLVKFCIYYLRGISSSFIQFLIFFCQRRITHPQSKIRNRLGKGFFFALFRVVSSGTNVTNLGANHISSLSRSSSQAFLRLIRLIEVRSPVFIHAWILAFTSDIYLYIFKICMSRGFRHLVLYLLRIDKYIQNSLYENLTRI